MSIPVNSLFSYLAAGFKRTSTREASARGCGSNAPERHDGQVVVPGRPCAEVREVSEARADQLAGQEFVVPAEEAKETFGRVLLARGVARFGEAVGEEKQRVARLHAQRARSELLVAENGKISLRSMATRPASR